MPQPLPQPIAAPSALGSPWVGADEPRAPATGPAAGPAATRRRARQARAALALLAGLLMGVGARAADLEVRLKPVGGDSGFVMVALAGDAASFMKTPLMAQQVAVSLRDAEGVVRIVFSGLPPGRYAISAYLDRNGNGKLDTNLMGLPSEPVGFSNGARANFGPPKFDEAAVALPALGARTEITLQ